MEEREFARELEGRRDRVKASCATWVGYGCPDLEDLIQEVMIAAWEKQAEVENLEAFLVRIARNVCLTYIRDRKEANELKEEYGAKVSDPVEKMALEDAIDKLPAKYRGIIKLKGEGWTVTEIASLEGVSLDVMSRKLTRAKKLLKELLDC